MKISCILVSHNKPDYVYEAIDSIISQSYQDWELILMDSGILHDQFNFQDPRIKLYKTNETEEIRQTKPMGPWSFNQAIQRNLTSGELILYACDDDILYPNAFETFANFAINNPHANAMYASQDLSIYKPGNPPDVYGQRLATQILGKNYPSPNCFIDGSQFCHRKEVQELWNEDLKYKTHADGVFMDKICQNHLCYPIDVKIGQNRRTPHSTHYPVPA